MKRLWSLLRSRRLDHDLEDEIAAHLAMQEEEFRRAGMSARDARDAALREFGGVTQAKEAYRDRRGVAWLDAAGKDLRHALRGLRQNKGFTAAAVVSLALGIGANTAIFTIFRALMLRTLPVSRPDQLVTLFRTGAWGRGYSSYPLYLEIRKRADLFEDVIARSSPEKTRFSAGGDRLESLNREYVTGNYFGALGIRPAIGRLIGEEDNRTPHAHPVAVLSYDFWQSRFGGDPGVLGRTLVVGEQPLTVIGVASRGFRGIEWDHRSDLWAPAMMRPGEIMERGSHWAWMVARRRAGVSRSQIQPAVDVLLKQYLAATYPENTNARFRKIALAQQIEVQEGGIGLSLLRDRFGTSLRVLMIAVGLVLLAACANVANLLLARGAARRKEFALRIALGAGRSRLVSQALIESFLLALAGAASGALLAYWGTAAILQFLPEPFPIAPDAGVLAFTLAISIAAAILFGLGPALRSAGADPALTLRSSTRLSKSLSTTRRLLVIVQVAFSVVLVSLAGLFSHSLKQLRSVDLGFRDDHVIAFMMDFPESWQARQKISPRDRLISELERLPGVSSVSYAFPGPYRAGSSRSTVRVAGGQAVAKEDEWSSVHKVAPRYFETLGAPILAGRDITVADTATSQRVAVVNEAFIRQFLPGDPNVLGRQLTAGSPQPLTIAGVARDIVHDGLRSKATPAVYVPASQEPPPIEPTILVRSALPPEALISAIRGRAAQAGPQIAVSDPRPLRDRIDESIFQDRLLATLGGFFGLLALALAAVGLYGVVAYGTAQRAREIGIRIALGARRGEVLRMVLGNALVLVAAGLALGLPASYAAARQVAALLFGVKPFDSASFAVTTAVLAAIGTVAALVPARRAAALEPLSVLRQD